MYCPYCGALAWGDKTGEMRCPGGGAFSRQLATRLAAAFPFGWRVESSVGGESHWRCPGCGSRLQKDGDTLVCPSCRADLEPFLHELLELNPHPPLDEAGKPAALTAFWITIHRRNAGPGLGVTAYDLADAQFIIEQFGYHIPVGSSVLADVRYENLDPFHVARHMGPIVVRGLWYPLIKLGL